MEEGPGNFSNRIRSIRARKQEHEAFASTKEAEEDARALKLIADKLEKAEGRPILWGGRWTLAIQSQLRVNGCGFQRIDLSDVQIWVE